MTQAASRASAPRFEIVRERDMPKPRARRATPSVVAAFFGAIRTVFEDAYVSLAQEVMVRAEQLEDARAERKHEKRVRKAARRRRKVGAERPAGPRSVR